MEDRQYIAIDLKSFYASVECVERGLDPLDANLVVADESRTDKTICLAVSPSLKALGIPGRARLFEVKQGVRRENARRKGKAPGGCFSGKETFASKLAADPSLELDFIIAKPRMAYYMEYSSRIYHIYMRFIAPEDILVYSIDEVFIDATHYLKTYGMTAHELAMLLVRTVLAETGITATAGIGTNMYLAKIAMDITAKHQQADRDGVRIAELDEMTYRRTLWDHRPLTDFWRIGKGIARRLEKNGMYTMGDVARCSVGPENSLLNEELLYRLFGVNAELLIDHAWGWEPATIADAKAFRPASTSLSSGQVLPEPYAARDGRLIVREMADQLVLELVKKGLVTDQLVLWVGYDIENLADPRKAAAYEGVVTVDRYGRKVPKPVRGTVTFPAYTSSSAKIIDAFASLYDRIVDPALSVRRFTVAAGRLITEREAAENPAAEQLSLFGDRALEEKRRAEEKNAAEREKRIQQALIGIRDRYGKNAVLKGMNLEKGATAVERNRQIGGHKA